MLGFFPQLYSLFFNKFRLQKMNFLHQKVLHSVIEQFLQTFWNSSEIKNISEKQIVFEVLKRSHVISKEVKSIASQVVAQKKIKDPDVQGVSVKLKIQNLVETLFEQDFVECALSVKEDSNNFYVLKDDLHDFLFTSAANGNNDVVSPYMTYFSYVPSDLFVTENSISSNSVFSDVYSCDYSLSSGLKETLLSSFENDRSRLLYAFNEEHSNTCLTLSKDESLKTTERDNSESSNSQVDTEYEPMTFSLGDFLDSSSGLNLDNFSETATQLSYSCWEKIMKQSIPCHLYSSELTDREVHWNVTDEDSQNFRVLFDPCGTFSESDLVFDILYMLIGIPSSTFCLDEVKNQFYLKPYTRFNCLSDVATFKLVERFIEAGTVFYILSKFCSVTSVSDSGYVLNGLKDGVRKILSTFSEYIVAVKASNPTLNHLRTDVDENCQLIVALGVICGIHLDDKTLTELPKGIDLLSYMNVSVWSLKNAKNSIMIAVLLKHVYDPYFRFLDKWMMEGTFCDPHDEFQIVQDYQYIQNEDEMYWDHAYTINPSKLIPLEIQKFSTDILHCGKSMQLLQSCCTKLEYIDHLSHIPSPSLSMIFSYRALNLKRQQCIHYFQNNPTAVLDDAESEEHRRLLEAQARLTRKEILQNVERRWNQLCFSALPKSIISFCSLTESKKEMRNFKSDYDISSFKEDNVFSGIIFSSTGILFPTAINHKKNTAAIEDVNYSSGVSRRSISRSHTCIETKSKELMFSSTQFEDLFPPGSFVYHLTDLLTSEFGETKVEIHTFLKMTSLQNLLHFNFTSVFEMRMHLIRRAITNYLNHELELLDFFCCLKNSYFLQDENFSRAICKRLFQRAVKCPSLKTFLDWSTLNEILVSALSVPAFAGTRFSETGSLIIVPQPEELFEKIRFFDFIRFQFKIQWPLNILLTEDLLIQYMQIFSFLLGIDFLCWLLTEVWRKQLLEIDCHPLNDSPQYKRMMLERFSMHQFIRIVRNCIYEELGGPLWESLLKELKSEELNIDIIRDEHSRYLSRALSRCFLSPDTHHLHETLDLLLRNVYQFSQASLDCCWTYNPLSDMFETPNFQEVTTYYDIFVKARDQFCSWITTNVYNERRRTSWDNLFIPFLQAIAETGKRMSS